jgi:RHS repeat-associated protein
VDFTVDDAGRISQAERAGQSVPFVYDGRGYLSRAGDLTAAPDGQAVPTYSSSGQLFVLRTQEASATPEEVARIFYLAGRPVALHRAVGGDAEWSYVTTDHLGAPMLATDSLGQEVWEGGFEPFGSDYQAGSSGGAAENGMFLRLPGQWTSEVWEGATEGARLFYNLNRWYEPLTGRYTQPDPLGITDVGLTWRSSDDLRHLYGYAQANPLVYIDPLGLKARLCCKPIGQGLGSHGFVGWLGETLLSPFYHCYAQVDDGTWGLHHVSGGYLTFGDGRVRRNHGFDLDGNPGECGEWNESCSADECTGIAANAYPGGLTGTSLYNFYTGPNSNTFARTVSDKCGLKPPPIAGTWHTPGWHSPPTSARRR